jgi:HK97 family phage major capsid protein
MTTPNQALIRNTAIAQDLAEMNSITTKPKMSREDRARFDFLATRVSALKAGFTPDDLAVDQINRASFRSGLPLVERHETEFSAEAIEEARCWQRFIKTGEVEKRVGEVGQPIISYEKFGSFVPVQFLSKLFLTLKQHDPLFDPEVVTFVETGRGGLMQCPIGSDIGNVAEPLLESADDTDNAADFTTTGHKQSKPKTYRSPLWYTSIEAEQDLNAFIPATDLWWAMASDRIARGVGRDLVNGNGLTGRILGLVPQLIAAGAVPVIAAGSAGNTGGVETGANSIGTKDLARLYTSVDQAYRKSSKAAWLMNDNSLAYLLGLVDKVGQPIVTISEGLPYIFRKPVLISPSLEDIGGSKNPVIFGDLSYFLTHSVKGNAYVKRYHEAPGLVEKGIVGFRVFARFDGQLLWDGSGNTPINILQNAS